MRNIVFFILVFTLFTGLEAQTRVIKGQLTVFNRYPVGNVQVSAKKAKTSVTTALDGSFEIVCKEKDILVVKNKVFVPLNRRVGKKDDFIQANLIFRDTPENRELATGMGYIREDQLTYALAHLEHENNDFCNYTDIFSLVKSKFPGVEVKTGGANGKGVFIRGQQSLQGSQEVLYVLDEVITSDISFINPCEVRSIDVLKGSGAAIYGGKAANGVLVIETKGKQTE